MLNDIFLFKILGMSLIILIPIILKEFHKNRKGKINFNASIQNDSTDNSEQIIKIPQEIDTEIIKIILSLIESKDFTLVENNTNNNTFKIIIKTSIQGMHWPVFIQLDGDLEFKSIAYFSWSEKYAIGQNSWNQSVMKSFILELKAIILYNGVNPIEDIKTKIGSSAYYRWNELAQKMLRNGKTKEQVINELVYYGLEKNLAFQIVEMHLKL